MPSLKEAIVSVARNQVLSGAKRMGSESLESEYDDDSVTSGGSVASRQISDDGVDSVFVSCFVGPGVHACRGRIDAPVFGRLGPDFYSARGIAGSVDLLTKLGEAVPSVRRKPKSQSLLWRVIDTCVMGIPKLEVSYHTMFPGRVVSAAQTVFLDGGAEVLVLGCMGTPVVAAELHKRVPVRYGKMPVVVSVGAATVAIQSVVRRSVNPRSISCGLSHQNLCNVAAQW
ncbi:hypothetical protein AN948_01140 [Rhodococcus sp. ADH]|nr:hypothetical protein AN948_01140 [Rhodococcus sp. ADH]RGP44596.1 hypothetical protein AWH04_27950 [Rhodococcus erythropolis]